MKTTQHAFSDLLRNPKEVIRDTDEGDVLLQRRGSPSLRLARADREEERTVAYTMAAKALRNVAVHSPEALSQILPEVFPWAGFLPRGDLQAFADEFTRAIASVLDLENPSPVIQLVSEWQRTAEIHADPKLARRLRKPLTPSGEPVSPPGS